MPGGLGTLFCQGKSALPRPLPGVLSVPLGVSVVFIDCTSASGGETLGGCLLESRDHGSCVQAGDGNGHQLARTAGLGETAGSQAAAPPGRGVNPRLTRFWGCPQGPVEGP